MSEVRFSEIFAHAPVSIWQEDFSAVGEWLEALRERGIQDLRAFLESEPDALQHGLSLVRLIDVNETTLRLWEVHSKEELLERWTELFTEETLDVFSGELLAIWEGRNRVSFECAARTATGRPIQYEMHWVAPEVEGGMNLQQVIVAIVDVTERKRVEDALRRSESNLAEAQRIARLGSFEWTPASGVVTWSDEVFRIFGHAPQAFFPSYEGFLDAVHPEDRTRVRESIEAALQGAPYDVHHRVVLPSGEVRVVRELGTVDRAPDGSPRRLVGTVQDVTELKSTEAALRASLEEKTVLLREIHHRVKNDLQIISSMLYMHGRRAGAGGVREVLEDSRERVRAMALVHETLYQADDLGRVEFGTYLERMLAGLWAAHQPPGIDTALEAVGPPLDIERAVPLGLVTNELVTNALKHAFPNGRRGVVRVSYRGEAGDGFSLSVGDDGVGLPDGMVVEKVDSLGLRLVSLLAAQLEAELRVDGPPGARFTLTRRTAAQIGQPRPDPLG